MGKVVGCGADVWGDEVADHEEVRREEEDGEEDPVPVEVVVGVEGEGEEGGFFDSEEEGGAGEHELFIRVLWRWFGEEGIPEGLKPLFALKM